LPEGKKSFSMRQSSKELMGIDTMKYLDVPFNFVPEPYTLLPRFSPTKRSKSVIKAQTIARFESKVAQDIKQSQSSEMDTYINTVDLPKVWLQPPRPKIELTPIQSLRTDSHDKGKEEFHRRRKMVKEHSMKIADELLMTKKEKEFNDAMKEFYPLTPSYKETRLPKIETRKDADKKNIKGPMQIKVSDIPLSVLYHDQVETIRAPMIRKGLDPRPITFQQIIQLPSRKLKAIKLQPFGIEDEQQHLDFLTVKNETLERVARNKVAFVNGSVRNKDPLLINIPRLAKTGKQRFHFHRREQSEFYELADSGKP